MSECEMYNVEKNGNNMDVSVHIKKPKPPKELRVEAKTLPANSKATVELINEKEFNTLLFGIPEGTKGEDFTGLTTEELETIIEQLSQLETIKGKDGVDGKDGKDGTNGRNGLDGRSIFIIGNTTDAEGNVVVTFSDGRRIIIPKGKDATGGLSIKDQTTAADGTMITEFSDGKSIVVPAKQFINISSPDKTITVEQAGSNVFISANNNSFVANYASRIKLTANVPVTVPIAQIQNTPAIWKYGGVSFNEIKIYVYIGDLTSYYGFNIHNKNKEVAQCETRLKYKKDYLSFGLGNNITYSIINTDTEGNILYNGRSINQFGSAFIKMISVHEVSILDHWESDRLYNISDFTLDLQSNVNMRVDYISIHASSTKQKNYG